MSLRPILELIPHRPPMALLDELLEHGPDHVKARMRVKGSIPFVDSAGRFPAWAGVELMAQSIAAWAGLQSRTRGEPVKVGFLLGTRRYRSECAWFPGGTELVISVNRLLVNDEGLGAFECSIESAAGNAFATVSVFQPADPSHMLTQSSR
jgi:predicted hotdog family 3-hydroxylacyl-ACP dehydratase